jgi:type VI secretion system secreted protein VgrG
MRCKCSANCRRVLTGGSRMVSLADASVVLHGPWTHDCPQRFRLRRVEGVEALGTCFEYTLTLDSADCDVSAEHVLGKRVRVDIALGARGARSVEGIVSELAHVGFVDSAARYKVVLRPCLWLLSRNRDCRVFEGQSVPEILAELFAYHGIAEVDFKLNETYKTRSQCVQYLESDLSFAQRLMHEEGLYYYFEQDAGRHLLVLADSPHAHTPVPGFERVPFRNAQKRGAPAMHRWTSRQRLLAAGVALTAAEQDHLELDIAHSRVDATQRVHHPVDVFDYPGVHQDFEEGVRQSRLRLDELLSDYELCEGATNAVALQAGVRFTLSGTPRGADNRAYLVVSQTFVLDCDASSGDGPRYYAQLRALDATRPYRMQQLRKPNRIVGAQVARVVTSDAAVAPRADAVRVRFSWDRQARLSRAGSCWAQVFQPPDHAACTDADWPRPGDDVLVEFLDGDPDRPVITGRTRAAEQGGLQDPLRGKPRILRPLHSTSPQASCTPASAIDPEPCGAAQRALTRAMRR